MDQVWAYRGILLQGTLTTCAVGLTALALALALGLVGAWGKLGRSQLGRRVAGAYTTLIRSIPDLCLMLLLYYGGQSLLNATGRATGWWGPLQIHQFTAGVLTIGVIFGAYMTETFRGAFLSIPKGQIEAAVAVGMAPALLFRRVIFPQLLGYALPGLGNNWMVLLKTTALVSIIGLQDVVWQAFTAGRATKNPFAFFIATMAIYLVLTALSDLVLGQLERRQAAFARRPFAP